jgi:hypothetical protein
MRSFPLCLVLSALAFELCQVPAACAGETGRDPLVDEISNRRLVELLGDEKEAVREKARKTLLERGRDAHHDVLEGTKSKSPEVRRRAAEVLVEYLFMPSRLSLAGDAMSLGEAMKEISRQKDMPLRLIDEKEALRMKKEPAPGYVPKWAAGMIGNPSLLPQHLTLVTERGVWPRMGAGVFSDVPLGAVSYTREPFWKIVGELERRGSCRLLGAPRLRRDLAVVTVKDPPGPTDFVGALRARFADSEIIYRWSKDGDVPESIRLAIDVQWESHCRIAALSVNPGLEARTKDRVVAKFAPLRVDMAVMPPGSSSCRLWVRLPYGDAAFIDALDVTVAADAVGDYTTVAFDGSGVHRAGKIGLNVISITAVSDKKAEVRAQLGSFGKEDEFVPDTALWNRMDVTLLAKDGTPMERELLTLWHLRPTEPVVLAFRPIGSSADPGKVRLAVPQTIARREITFHLKAVPLPRAKAGPSR